jgi:uncharacterized protein YfaS (alpha-2-macroglobulin family)
VGLSEWDPDAPAVDPFLGVPIEASSRRGTVPPLARRERPDRVELLDDRVVLFATATPDWRIYRYALRAVAAGRFEVPPVQASSMYAATLSSVSGGGALEVAR